MVPKLRKIFSDYDKGLYYVVQKYFHIMTFSALAQQTCYGNIYQVIKIHLKTKSLEKVLEKYNFGNN